MIARTFHVHSDMSALGLFFPRLVVVGALHMLHLVTDTDYNASYLDTSQHESRWFSSYAEKGRRR